MTKICFLASNNLQNDPRVLRLVKGAYLDGFEARALGFYWIAPGQELPEIDKNNGYTIQRVLYKPGQILKYSNKAYPMIIYIGLCLIYAWLKFLVDHLQGKKGGQIRKDPPVNLASQETTQNIVQDNNISLLTKIKLLIYNFKVKLFKKFTPLIASVDYYAAMAYHLSEEASKFNPDIVYSNDLDSLWAGYLVKKKTGAKLIFDAHEFWLDMGLQVPKFIVWAFKMSEKFLLGKIDGYVTVNNKIIQKTQNFYNHKFRVPTVVAFNCPYYQKKKMLNKSGKIKILYQGRFALHRGLEQVVKAMKYLPSKAHLYLRAIKDPAMENILEKIIIEQRIDQKVTFLPAVKMEKMVERAMDFDIGIVAYVPVHSDNKFCAPNKLFEYMMAGLALAVSNLPVLRYVVKKYKNGVMFNPTDPQSIARALKILISSSKKLNEAQQNSLIAAKEEFNWEAQQKKLLNLYQKVLGN